MWLAQAMARSKRLWGFDDSERTVLVEATAMIPKLRAMVDRAERRAELGGAWVVQATVKELDEMYSLVEALMDATRRRKRLDGMLASLCTSIDRSVRQSCARRSMDLRSARRQCVAGAKHRQIVLADVELRMGGEDPIGEQIAQLGLRPALDDVPSDEMQIRTRVDVVGDAGRDDGQDGGGALTADVEPGEEPIFSPMRSSA